MTGHEKYLKYCEMCDRIVHIHDNYARYLLANGNDIKSDLFISVGDEENELFFIDVEFTDSHGLYHRIYGNKDMKRFY